MISGLAMGLGSRRSRERFRNGLQATNVHGRRMFRLACAFLLARLFQQLLLAGFADMGIMMHPRAYGRANVCEWWCRVGGWSHHRALSLSRSGCMRAAGLRATWFPTGIVTLGPIAPSRFLACSRLLSFCNTAAQL
jgi:hypothetical protein